jgi:hypothetical protein
LENQVSRRERQSKGVSVISRKNQVTLPIRALKDAGSAPEGDVRVQVIAPERLEIVRVDGLVEANTNRARPRDPPSCVRARDAFAPLTAVRAAVVPAPAPASGLGAGACAFKRGARP